MCNARLAPRLGRAADKACRAMTDPVWQQAEEPAGALGAACYQASKALEQLDHGLRCGRWDSRLSWSAGKLVVRHPPYHLNRKGAKRPEWGRLHVIFDAAQHKLWVHDVRFGEKVVDHLAQFPGPQDATFRPDPLACGAVAGISDYLGAHDLALADGGNQGDAR